MLKATLCTWIHGIEPEHFDPSAIEACIQAVTKSVKADNPAVELYNQIYNWSQIIDGREQETYEIARKRGNWLTRKVRYYICQYGLDMWYYLSTKRGAEPGDWYFDIQAGLADALEGMRTALSSHGYEIDIAFVAHSWGTKVALDWIIAHQDVKVRLITIGSPLPIYGSSCFKNWGDPTLLSNLTSWTNISIQNDPVSNLMADNPNPAWKGIVKDYNVSTWDILPIHAHTAYWNNRTVRKLIAQSLIAHS